MAVKHSIIIPCRGRERYVNLCIRSIKVSQRTTCINDFEIIVVGGDQKGKIFNKSAALNNGIDRANGEVFTFLDCDAIVSPLWLESVARESFAITNRLCYRVKRASKADSNLITRHGDWQFAYENWDVMHTAYEHHRLWSPLPKGLKKAPIGNSQFSIHRDFLGDLRYDESYEGWGWEDLSFILRLFRSHDGLVNDRLVDSKDYAMIHLAHPYDRLSWRDKVKNRSNKTRFIQLCKEDNACSN